MVKEVIIIINANKNTHFVLHTLPFFGHALLFLHILYRFTLLLLLLWFGMKLRDDEIIPWTIPHVTRIEIDLLHVQYSIGCAHPENHQTINDSISRQLKLRYGPYFAVHFMCSSVFSSSSSSSSTYLSFSPIFFSQIWRVIEWVCIDGSTWISAHTAGHCIGDCRHNTYIWSLVVLQPFSIIEFRELFSVGSDAMK